MFIFHDNNLRFMPLSGVFFVSFLYKTKMISLAQGNYEGDGNGIFYVFIQVTDDQHLSGETNF